MAYATNTFVRYKLELKRNESDTFRSNGGIEIAREELIALRQDSLASIISKSKGREPFSSQWKNLSLKAWINGGQKSSFRQSAPLSSCIKIPDAPGEEPQNARQSL